MSRKPLPNTSNDSQQHGLVKLSGPTGTGKTYAVMSHIADELIERGPDCRRYVFATNVKRNLPVDLLLNLLEERGHPELAEFVVNLDSNVGMFVSNLDEAEKAMPNAPFKYLEKRPKQSGGEGLAAAEAEFDIKTLPELQDAKKLRRCVEDVKNQSYRDSDAREMAVKGPEENLEKAERSLRNAIACVFRSMCVPGKDECRLMSPSEKRELVEKSAWWKWLRILYPSALAFKKRVLFMSVSKLLVKNCPIFGPSESIWESDLLEGSVVVIDEFELSKKVINDFIIDESVKKMEDSVSLFRTLFGPALEGRHVGEGSGESSGLILTGELFRSPSDGKGTGPRLREEYEMMSKVAGEVYTLLHLNRQFRLSEELRHKNQAFLFNDFQSYVVATGSDSWAAVQFLETQNVVRLGSEVPPYADGSSESGEGGYYSVPLLLSRLEGIESWCILWVTRVADNYQRVVAEDADEGKRPEISFDQAVGTVLSELNIMDEVRGGKNPTRERIVAMAHDERARRIAADDDAHDGPVNLCLYRTGFRVHAFAESEQHDTLTRMERYGVSCMAEQKLIELCSRNLVVGISASLDIPSVLGNYDLNYVEGALQDLCTPLNNDQKALIRADYESSISHYDNVDIRVVEVADANAEGRYDERAWLAVVDDAAAARRMYNEAALKFGSADDSTFQQQRVLKVCTAFKDFWAANDARAMLCVLNALPKEGSPSFDLAELKGLFKSILALQDVDVDVDEAVCVLGGSNEEFGRLKKAALTRLAAGEKLFVITTYQSAGAGQNLQYRIPKGVHPVKINDRPASEKMDFDSLYLEAPTHTSPVIIEGEHLDEAGALGHILGCEYLYENAEISRGSLLDSITAALRALGGVGRDYGYKSADSARMLAAKQVYQATGRLGRTNMKMPVIRLFVDEHLMEGVPLGALRSCGVAFTPEFEAIVNAFDVRPPQLSTEAGRLARKSARASERSRSCINSLLGSGWHSDSRHAWFDLGDQVLRFPTLPDGWNEAPYLERNYYVEFEEARTSYRYTSEDDFRKVAVLFDSDSGVKGFAVSERAARLDKFMRIPGMKEHFAEQGFATEWKPSKRIMTPVVAESIYKGRLGEVCGRFILEKSGIAVKGIDDAETFEKFDFLLPGIDGDQRVYIDFKHWKKPSDKTGWESERLVDWVFEKMELIGAERAIIANILPPDGMRYQNVGRSKNGRKLLIVPALVKSDCSFDETAIQTIRSFADGLENQ